MIRDRLARIAKEFKRDRLQHAREIADRDLKEMELEERMRYLQSKTQRQARTIRSMEAKLVNRGQKPYEETHG